MPTNYTYRIETGCSFEEFVWGCASGIDYFLSLQGGDGDLEYCREALEQARTEHRKSSQMTVLEAQEEIRDINDRRQREYVDRLQKFKETDLLYREMRDRVESWVPPSPQHESLKKFMIDQIDSSRRSSPTPPTMITETPESYIQSKIEDSQNEIGYHKRMIERRLRSREKSGEWIKQLRESVPPPKDTTLPPIG